MMPPIASPEPAVNPEDRAFLAAFESGALPAEDFHHRDHVRVAWLYLLEHSPAAALARFAEALRRFAAAQGHPGLYHETITWAYLLLIRERMARSETGPDATFEEFAAAHPDLFTWKPSILARYYREETLGTELARRVFLLPDRYTGGIPPAGEDAGGPRDKACLEEEKLKSQAKTS